MGTIRVWTAATVAMGLLAGCGGGGGGGSINPPSSPPLGSELSLLGLQDYGRTLDDEIDKGTESDFTDDEQITRPGAFPSGSYTYRGVGDFDVSRESGVSALAGQLLLTADYNRNVMTGTMSYLRSSSNSYAGSLILNGAISRAQPTETDPFAIEGRISGDLTAAQGGAETWLGTFRLGVVNGNNGTEPARYLEGIANGSIDSVSNIGDGNFTGALIARR